jgi:hypothetical protein
MAPAAVQDPVAPVTPLRTSIIGTKEGGQYAGKAPAQAGARMSA